MSESAPVVLLAIDAPREPDVSRAPAAPRDVAPPTLPRPDPLGARSRRVRSYNPEPGSPVLRYAPRLPTFTERPGIPAVTLTPDPDRFNLTPGIMVIRLRNFIRFRPKNRTTRPALFEAVSARQALSFYTQLILSLLAVLLPREKSHSYCPSIDGTILEIPM